MSYLHIFAFLFPEMSYLQKQEIALGIENGLREEQVSFYGYRFLNHEKMRELRLGLEHGLDRKSLRRMRSLREASLMREMRKKLEKGELLQRRSLFVPAVFAMTLVLTLCSDLLAKREPYLDLKCEEAEITQGEDFNASSYISDYFMKGGTLVLPDVDTSKPQDVIAVYTLKSRDRQITKTLHIHIVKKDP